MASPASLSLLDRLRQRAEALPLDRAPLRRAGLLTVLLIALLALGRVFSPAPAPSADRQDVRSATEEVSEPTAGAMWTGGRVLAILFLVTGGGIAFWLHRRSGGRAVATGSTLQVLETHTLGPGQSLRLLACGDEVLLLSVASDGATLLRHWPRAAFEAEPVSFADALASLAADPDRTQAFHASSTDVTSHQLRMESRIRGNDGINDGIEESIGPDELATPPGEPALGRGALFPHRAAPHQFDVRHG